MEASDRPSGGAVPIGLSVGGYEIVRQIGAGELGAVFLAEHPLIGRRAAVKILHTGVDQELQREAYAAARVAHQNCVEVFDLTTLPDGRLCLVMEYVEGRTLADRMAEGTPRPTYSLSILRQTCRGLGAFHASGLTHRHVTPRNIVLTQREGEELVKLVDYSLEPVEPPAAPPHYLAPEQIAGGSVDARADVYSTAVVAYELLTGSRPFEGGSFEEIADKHLRMTPRFPASLPPPIRFVLDRALAKEPDERFADAVELGVAFEEARAASYPPATLPRVGRTPTVIQRDDVESTETTAPISIDRSETDTTEVTGPMAVVPEMTGPWLPSLGADPAAQLTGDHYAFLGLAHSADDAEVTLAAERIEADIAAAGGALDPDRQSFLRAVSERLADARRTLLDTRTRALYDAEIGNLHGVAHCVRSGLDAQEIAELHERFAKRFPGRMERAEQLRASAEALRDEGRVAEALPVLEEALTLAPLSLGLHRLHLELFQRLHAST